MLLRFGDMKTNLKANFLFYLIVFLSFSVNAQLHKVSYSNLQHRIENPENDTLYVVNFWATWCAPCVHELPGFKHAQDSVVSANTKYIFVSLDFPGKEEQVSALFNKQKLEGELIMLTDTDANDWIFKVNKDWQGNIPVTLMSNPFKGVTYFHEGTIEANALINKIGSLNK